MLVAAKVQQVELVDQTVALEEVKGAVDGNAMDARVQLLGAFEDGSGVQMAFGLVHHFNEDFALAREANAALGQGGL
jgi:hypothetical protein